MEVEDPYIRIHHQLVNFLRFAEMLALAKRDGVCPALARLHLLTGKEMGQQGQQQDAAFAEIQNSLRPHGIGLKVNFSTTLHDREIRYSSLRG